jgi:hypothetical protein
LGDDGRGLGALGGLGGFGVGGQQDRALLLVLVEHSRCLGCGMGEGGMGVGLDRGDLGWCGGVLGDLFGCRGVSVLLGCVGGVDGLSGLGLPSWLSAAMEGPTPVLVRDASLFGILGLDIDAADVRRLGDGQWAGVVDAVVHGLGLNVMGEQDCGAVMCGMLDGSGRASVGGGAHRAVGVVSRAGLARDDIGVFVGALGELGGAAAGPRRLTGAGCGAMLGGVASQAGLARGDLDVGVGAGRHLARVEGGALLAGWGRVGGISAHGD